MLTDTYKRESDVLDMIIRTYVETAEPVGSRFVARQLGFSSATIRNVMADLEEAGLIMHPHTSAGRIPTDKGYRLYIDSLMRKRTVSESIAGTIRQQYEATIRSLEDVMERTSRLISILKNQVGVALYPTTGKVYLDGTSHIIEQPEFKDLKKLYAIIKYLEEKTNLLNLLSEESFNDGLTVHIGDENHLSYLKECSVVTR